MKQIIERFNGGSIIYEYYMNDRGQKHGLDMDYWVNHNIMRKRNYVNGKQYGINITYNSNGKIKKQTYYL